MTERDIYVGLGSNIDPQRHMSAALQALSRDYGPLTVSTLYRSEPLGMEGPDFINAVVGFASDVSLDALRARLKTLERESGRDHAAKLAGRELDLDLLLYGDQTIGTGELVIPRPDVLDYAFVLRPLAEIAPTKLHPVTGRGYAWHWEHFEGRQIALAPIIVGSAKAGNKR
jgi:2-amino-4-hydroxy-6-hydroxymethyldihydropteridine diphosphokinase